MSAYRLSHLLSCMNESPQKGTKKLEKEEEEEDEGAGGGGGGGGKQMEETQSKRCAETQETMRQTRHI